LDLGTGDFSVGLWVKIPFAGIKQVGYWPGIFGKGGGTTAPAKTWGFDRQTSTVDRIHWAQATEGGGAYQVAITTPVLTSGWHHVNAIRSSDTTTLYVDGKSVGVDTSAGGDLSNDNDIRIGRECSLSYNINNFNNQSVDDVKIYNYARTPAQIAWDYNRGKAVNNWTFDEGSGTTVHDEGDNKNDGTITGATWKNESECKTGKCLSFDGTDDQVSSNGNVDLSGTNKVSTSFWFKFATSDSTARIVLEHSTDFNSNNAFMIDHSDSGVDGNFTLADKCSINYNLIYTDNSYGDNQWHHFVGVIDRSLGINQNFIYIDGQIVPVTQSYNYNCNENFSSYPLYLGSRSGSNNDYTGQIDNVKIFNYALTAEQVKMEYNGGAVSFE
jgi:hypothetical protein